MERNGGGEQTPTLSRKRTELSKTQGTEKVIACDSELKKEERQCRSEGLNRLGERMASHHMFDGRAATEFTGRHTR